MTVYRTCHNCKWAKEPCSRREEVQQGLKGLDVHSVKFRCSARRPIYHPGQRVAVSWYVPCPDGHYDDGSLETWPATVTDESGSKFIIVVDDVKSDHETPAREYIKNESLFCKVSSGKLSPIDEPARPVCKMCGELGPDYPACWDGLSTRCMKAQS